MAVLHDGEANLTGRHASAATWTLSGKTTAGSDRVGVVRFMASTDSPVTSVTWGGVAMTLVGSVVRSDATIYAYEIPAPPTEASDVLIAFTSGSPSGPYTVSSYNGVDQTTPIRNQGAGALFVSATGTSTTPSVNVTSATGDLVLDAMDVAQVISSVGANQTTEFLDTAGGSDRFGASREAGAATVTMSWTTGSAGWSILAFSLNAATGGEPDPSTGSGEGTSTVSATGSALASAVSTVAGIATAVAVGSALVLGAAASNGTSTASATGAALVAASGSAAGAATGQATGSSLAAADGTADGTSAVTAVGASLAAATGTAAGTSSVSATSEIASAGTAAGTSTATATGSSLASATGTAAGTSTVSATSGEFSAGTAAGTSTATAVGSSLVDAAGAAAGTSTAAATGVSTSDAAASSAGLSTAAATGSSLVDATATAAGTSTSSAVGSTAEDVIPDVIVLSAATWATPTLTSAAFSVPAIVETWAAPALSDQSFTPTL